MKEQPELNDDLTPQDSTARDWLPAEYQSEMTPEEMAAGFNRRKWRGQTDWFVWNPESPTTEIVSQSLYDLPQFAHCSIYVVDARAILTGLKAQDELAELRVKFSVYKESVLEELDTACQERKELAAAVASLTEENAGLQKRVKYLESRVRQEQEIERHNTGKYYDLKKETDGAKAAAPPLEQPDLDACLHCNGPCLLSIAQGEQPKLIVTVSQPTEETVTCPRCAAIWPLSLAGWREAGEPDLDAIEARANAATEGPWEAVCDSSRPDVLTENRKGGYFDAGHLFGLDKYDNNDADAEFIAHARTDIPALLTELRRSERAPHLIVCNYPRGRVEK